MPSVMPILVYARPEPTDAWHRFAAGLCFLEAYYYFSVDGAWIGSIIAVVLSGMPQRGYLLLWATMLLRPVIFMAVGAALWWRHKLLKAVFWLAVGICMASIVSVWHYQVNLYRPSAATGRIRPPAMRILERVVEEAMEQVPWFALAIAGYWCHSRARRDAVGGRQLWVVCAAAWFAAQSVPAVVLDFGGPWSSEIIPLPKTFRPLARVLTGAIFATAAISLLCQWRRSRWLMLAGFAVSLVGSLYWDIRSYEYTLKVQGFMKWFSEWQLICLPGFVLSVGQWALAAWLAFRGPLHQTPDDGSPYPRLYCGRCLYNLRGITWGRCPECGTELVLPTDADRGATRQ